MLFFLFSSPFSLVAELETFFLSLSLLPLPHPLFASAQNQGIPEGFTRICDTPKDSPPSAILGFKDDGHHNQCWKKMSVVAGTPSPFTESSDSEANGTKTARMSLNVVLTVVGTALLFLL